MLDIVIEACKAPSMDVLPHPHMVFYLHVTLEKDTSFGLPGEQE